MGKNSDVRGVHMHMHMAMLGVLKSIYQGLLKLPNLLMLMEQWTVEGFVQRSRILFFLFSPPLPFPQLVKRESYLIKLVLQVHVTIYVKRIGWVELKKIDSEFLKEKNQV